MNYDNTEERISRHKGQKKRIFFISPKAYGKATTTTRVTLVLKTTAMCVWQRGGPEYLLEEKRSMCIMAKPNIIQFRSVCVLLLYLYPSNSVIFNLERVSILVSIHMSGKDFQGIWWGPLITTIGGEVPPLLEKGRWYAWHFFSLARPYSTTYLFTTSQQGLNYLTFEWPAAGFYLFFTTAPFKGCRDTKNTLLLA